MNKARDLMRVNLDLDKTVLEEVIKLSGLKTTCKFCFTSSRKRTKAKGYI